MSQAARREIKYQTMFGLWAILRSLRNEYLGWRKFKDATGVWPVYSIVTDIFSLPVLFAAVVFAFIEVLSTRWLGLIYTVLFSSGFIAAALWWGFRRFACKADVSRGRRLASQMNSADALEGFLR
jgi:hypothetical protein